MQNNLKDNDVFDIPSLKLDRDEDACLVAHRTCADVDHKKSNKALWVALFLIVCLFFSGLTMMYWIVKQSMSDVRSQLAVKSQTTSASVQNTTSQLQKVLGQVNSQEMAMDMRLESMNAQLKNIVGRLSALESTQQKLLASQKENSEKIALLEQGTTDQRIASMSFQQLTDEVNLLKKNQPTEAKFDELSGDIQALKKQDSSESLKALQNDVLLLRSQLDAKLASNENDEPIEALQAKLNQSVQSIQSQIQNLQTQLDNKPVY